MTIDISRRKFLIGGLSAAAAVAILPDLPTIHAEEVAAKDTGPTIVFQASEDGITWTDLKTGIRRVPALDAHEFRAPMRSRSSLEIAVHEAVRRAGSAA
jgi:hypothetical protein